MSLIVQKFGGSSVADAESIKRVAKRIVETRKAGHAVVVAVSAMGDTTDELIDLALEVPPQPDPREMDMLLTTGERISMALLAMAIKSMGHEARSFTGSQAGMITDALGYDERIGRRFLGAGIGFGGGCLPKDIRAFAARAEELGRGESVAFLREVDEINLRRRERAVQLVIDALGGSVYQKRIAVLGAAFKPFSDDVRDSPALDVAVRLFGLGADVRVTDPEAIDNARRLQPQLTYVTDRDEAIRDADAIVLVTEWDTYRRELSAKHASSLTKGRAIVDGRNCLDPAEWRAAGWQYVGLGRR